MRTRRPDPDHEQTVARRLALLAAQAGAPVAAGGGGSGPGEDTPEEPWWAGHTRVRGDQPARPEVLGVPPAPGAVPVPLPGRHAARRDGRLAAPLVGRLPAQASRRVSLGLPQVAVLCVLVSLAFGATCWWVVRADPVPVAAPGPVLGGEGSEVAPDLVALTPASSEATGAGRPGDPDGSPQEATVTVDVAGKVRRPGIAVLPEGSRVVDALEAAGGARPGVDLTSLNLARVLVDGEQLLVGVRTVAPAAAPGASGAPAVPGATPGALVDLNTADLALLDTLPDVGPVTAQAIITWREEHGGFTAVEELLEVDGIGQATLASLAPLVTV